MEYMTTIPESNAQSIVIGWTGIGLIFNGRLIDGIATDGTMLGTGIPAPHGDTVPFFDFESWGWERTA